MQRRMAIANLTEACSVLTVGTRPDTVAISIAICRATVGSRYIVRTVASRRAGCEVYNATQKPCTPADLYRLTQEYAEMRLDNGCACAFLRDSSGNTIYARLDTAKASPIVCGQMFKYNLIIVTERFEMFLAG